MSISNDYLDVDSIENTQILAPLARTIHDDDMVVVACTVDIVFQTHRSGWLWPTVTTNSISKELELFGKILQARHKQAHSSPIVSILRKLVPLISLNISDMTEKDLTLIAETSKLIREDIKTTNEFILAFITASLGNDKSEIDQKITAFSREQFQNLKADTKQKILNSSDLELFQEIQSLFPNLVFIVKMICGVDIETPLHAKKEEFSKIFNCYAEAIKQVQNRPGIKQLTKIDVIVLLAKRFDLGKLDFGYYQVSNQQQGEWIWNPGQKTPS